MNRAFRLFAIMLALLPSVASAATSGLPDEAQPKYFVSFADQRRWNFEMFGTGLADLSNRHVAMGGVTTGVGYYVLDNLAINLELTEFGVSVDQRDGAATAVSLGLRHHLLNIGSASLFIDVAGGAIDATTAVPRHGTHLNNTFDVGPGLAFPLRDNVSLITGVRYFHLSNAGREGQDRNPSVNAIQGLVGIMWRF